MKTNYFDRKKFFGLLFLISVCSLNLFGQEDETPSETWNLPQCIEYGIENNINIQQSNLTVKSSENNYIQSKIARYPTVNASATQGLSFGRSINPFSNSFVEERILSNNFGIFASWTVFNGFQQQNTIQSNQLTLEANKLSVQQSEYDVSLNIALAYLNILLAQELLDASQHQVEATTEQLERTQKLYDAGAVAINEVVDLEAQLANERLNIVTSENDVRLATLNLMQLMNYPASESFEVQGVEIDDFEASPYPESSEEIYNTAVTTLPGVLSAEKNVEVSEKNVEIAEGGVYPTVTLEGNLTSGYSSAQSLFDQQTTLETVQIGTVDGTNQTVSAIVPNTTTTAQDYPFDSQINDNFSQSLTLRVQIPIFNGRQVKTNIANSKISVDNARLTAENTRIQLRQDIEQAYNNTIAAANTYNAQKSQVDALELALVTAQKRLDAGAGNIVEFNVAKNNLNAATSRLIRAKYDYLFRTKVLDFYQNKPLTLD